MKFSSGTLKAMLVEKLHKRYNINKEIAARRTIDAVEGVKSQRHLKHVETQKVYDVKAMGGTQKKFMKRRTSRQGSKDSIGKKYITPR